MMYSVSVSQRTQACASWLKRPDEVPSAELTRVIPFGQDCRICWFVVASFAQVPTGSHRGSGANAHVLSSQRAPAGHVEHTNGAPVAEIRYSATSHAHCE
eukprot:3935699-Rhodomonas_salina.1